MKYEVVPASILHVKAMSKKMRAASILMLESYGLDPRTALRRAVRTAFYSRTALSADGPVAMWGVTGTLMGEVAYVWLVIAQDIISFPLSIAREARAELASIMEHYREIQTTVLPHDEAAVRFAVYLGFHDPDDGAGRSRKEIQRDIMENPEYRIPVGDSYVIGLTYHPAEKH